jgi:RHS repeat-associated protein
VGYDGNFNLTSYNGASFSYDAENHLVGESMQATYDGLGRCVRRTTSSGTRLYTYDEWNPIVEWDQWGNFAAWNMYGSRPDAILVRWDAVHGAMIYKQDHHGNVVALLDSSGNILERYTYDAFGKPKVTAFWDDNDRGGSWYGNRFMFQGREYFPELGIYDYRHRMYQPELGRFLQTDPTGFDPGDMNLFRYCGDDPVDLSDPMGLLSGFKEYMLVYDKNERLDDTHDGYHIGGVKGTEDKPGDRVHLEVDRGVRTSSGTAGGTTHETTASNVNGTPTVHEQINVRYAGDAGPKTKTFAQNNEWTHSADLVNSANAYRASADRWAGKLGLSSSGILGLLQNGLVSGGMSYPSAARAGAKARAESQQRWDETPEKKIMHTGGWRAPNGTYVWPHSPIDPESGNPLDFKR